MNDYSPVGSDKEPFDPIDWLKKYWKPVAIVVVLVIAVVSVIGILNWRRGVRAEGYEWQNYSMAKYQKIDTTAGNCFNSTLVSAQIAEEERQSLMETLKETVKGWSFDENGNQLDMGTPASAGLAINALRAAYPNVSNELFDKLQTTAVKCRADIADAQLDLQAYTARFKTWTKSSDIITGSIREDFPNEELRIEGPNGDLTGMAALEFMATPISSDDVKQMLQDKALPDQQLFGDDEATPAPSAS